MKILLLATKPGKACRPTFKHMPLCVEQVIGPPFIRAKYRQNIGMRTSLVSHIYNNVRDSGWLDRR
jgi:hypothetical protein